MVKSVKSISPFVLVLIILAAAAFIFFVPCFKTAEPFVDKCDEMTPCDTAVISTLLGCPSIGSTALKIYSPSQGHVDELQRLKAKVAEAAVASLRGAHSWAVFYAGPNFNGQAFLVPVGEDLTYYLEDGEGLQSTAALRDFVRDFGFYYGRRFSCVLPEGRKMTLTPVAGGGYPAEPVVLGPGSHTHVIYGKGPLLTVMTSASGVAPPHDA